MRNFFHHFYGSVRYQHIIFHLLTVTLISVAFPATAQRSSIVYQFLIVFHFVVLEYMRLLNGKYLSIRFLFFVCFLGLAP